MGLVWEPRDNIEPRLISIAYLNSNGKTIPVDAQWDTGATISCISEDVVDSLELKAITYRKIVTPSGSDIVRAFVVDVALTDDIIMNNVLVCESKIGLQKIDLLIGMNILSKGDFAVSNFSGRTVFAFRSPSCGDVNFDMINDTTKEAAATNDNE